MTTITFTEYGYLQEEDWHNVITAAISIRKEIVEGGGMATKSLVENRLMNVFDGLDRYNAHSVMNHIEYHNLR